MSAYDRAYYLRNRERILAYAASYREANRDRLREKQAEYLERNRESQRAWHRSPRAKALQRRRKSEWNAEKREMVLRQYSGGVPECRSCHITDLDVLTIDHIHGGGRKHREEIKAFGNTTSLYLWLIRNGYPEGFQVLCMNCNLKKYKQEHRARVRAGWAV